MASNTIHSLPLEAIRNIFELLRFEHSTRWTVSQVCKKWRQAALDSSALWSTYLYLNPDITVLYKDILPRTKVRKIDNLILSSASFPILSWNELDLKKIPFPVSDPSIDIKLVVTVPNLILRTRNLSLEVPLESWHRLKLIFQPNINISDSLERLELTRRFCGEGTDSSFPEDYTSVTLNSALRDAHEPWKLRALHLHHCGLDLAAEYALRNLEELSLYNLPEIVSYPPRMLVGILYGLPQLKRLHLTWVTTSQPTSLEPFENPTELNVLETLSLTGPIDHCSFIFGSLSLPPTCKVQIIGSDISSVAINGLVDQCLTEIASRHRSNIGSHLLDDSIVSLQVKSEFCGIQPLDTHQYSGNDAPTSPSFILVLLSKDLTTALNANAQNPAPIDLAHLFRLLLRFSGDIFPSAMNLRLDIDTLPTGRPEKDQEKYYRLQMNVVRSQFPRLRHLSLKYPSGVLIFPEES